ncbi:hypothetical protein [Arsenicibacter rosenii]|uniref:Uncharacterized protein n=1 Tax=Arsenicibacter rosenii TaxID=1750698 RepID=A0A1S2VEA6_9BACT|nr:hypothetical protein [Arsenicibacter rosenii]OIN56526.1 hypothetical protein BLX24_23925 [Arsenicibacter rosenii]
MKNIITTTSLMLTLSALPLISFAQDSTKVENPCERIEVERDKFENKSVFRMPGLRRARITKYIEKGVSSYYLVLTTTGSVATVSNKGAIILLSNGKKILKPAAEIDTDVNEYKSAGPGDFEYSAFIRLTPVDIEQLKKNQITAFKLYIFPQDVSDNEGSWIKVYLNCLLTMK